MSMAAGGMYALAKPAEPRDITGASWSAAMTVVDVGGWV